MTLANVFALEDTENKDLNDDGVIGNAIVSTYNVADESGVIVRDFIKIKLLVIILLIIKV